MSKKLIQFVFQINQESLQHFEILLKEILPQSLHEGTLKQFHYQYDPNNTNYTLFQTSIAQFKKLLYSNVFNEEDTWFFCCQSKTTYFECIKINSTLYTSIIIKGIYYIKHIHIIEKFSTLIDTLTSTQNDLTENEEKIFIQKHHNLFMLSPLSKDQLCNLLKR